MPPTISHKINKPVKSRLNGSTVSAYIAKVLTALAILLAICVTTPGASSGTEITGYRAVLRPYHAKDGSLRIAIREFIDGTDAKVLSIDPITFETSVIDAQETSNASVNNEWQKTPFAVSLARYTAPDGRLQNSGIRRGEAKVDGLFLTVDLCPSKKPLDRALFEATIKDFIGKKGPAPLAIAVSGLWMARHQEDLRWLLDKSASGELDITWINHSATHPYHGDRPLEEDFLQSVEVDFEREVLANEVEMLNSGIRPTVFFRFPGLVSDNRLLKRLRALSLIPIGTDAWLAKKENPKRGSIILVHGNGNEPEGLAILMGLYKGHLADGKIEAEKDWLQLLPLRDAFRER